MAKIKQLEKESRGIETLRVKAKILDDLLGLLEDRCLGQLMHNVERERNDPLSRAKRSLR